MKKSESNLSRVPEGASKKILHDARGGRPSGRTAESAILPHPGEPSFPEPGGLQRRRAEEISQLARPVAGFLANNPARRRRLARGS